MNILKTTLSLGLLCLVLTLGLTTCKSVVENTSEHPVIVKPFKTLDVNPNQYAIRTDRDTILTVQSGTHISIPANTLVDANDKVIEGEVIIEYTEYQKPADILISGIQMIYDSAGTTYGFESAGMFNLDASTAGGDPVFIKDGGTIDVAMGSYRDGDDYTFYYLDTVANAWQSVGTAKPEANVSKKGRIDSLNQEMEKTTREQSELKIPKKFKKGDKIINLDINYSKVPELRPFHSLIWRYAGINGEGDPEKNAWIYNEQWTSIQLDPSTTVSGKYDLRLKKKDKSFQTVIEPVLQGKDLAKAEQALQKQMKEYDQILTTMKNEVLRANQEAELLRSFEVSRFGIYNWDRFFKEPESINVMANFDFDKPVPGAEKITIYLVVESRNAVIPYYKDQARMFSFIPYEKNKLIAVLPENRIAVFTAEDFAALEKRAPAMKGKPFTFKLKVLDKKMEKDEDVSNLLASI